MSNTYCPHCNATLEMTQACQCPKAKEEHAKWLRDLFGPQEDGGTSAMALGHE